MAAFVCVVCARARLRFSIDTIGGTLVSVENTIITHYSYGHIQFVFFFFLLLRSYSLSATTVAARSRWYQTRPKFLLLACDVVFMPCYTHHLGHPNANICNVVSHCHESHRVLLARLSVFSRRSERNTKGQRERKLKTMNKEISLVSDTHFFDLMRATETNDFSAAAKLKSRAPRRTGS